jgi:hypothetical protein
MPRRSTINVLENPRRGTFDGNGERNGASKTTATPLEDFFF